MSIATQLGTEHSNNARKTLVACFWIACFWVVWLAEQMETTAALLLRLKVFSRYGYLGFT